jgi:hypothetical protein
MRLCSQDSEYRHRVSVPRNLRPFVIQLARPSTPLCWNSWWWQTHVLRSAEHVPQLLALRKYSESVVCSQTAFTLPSVYDTVASYACLISSDNSSNWDFLSSPRFRKFPSFSPVWFVPSLFCLLFHYFFISFSPIILFFTYFRHCFYLSLSFYFFTFLHYFPYFEKKIRILRSPCCVYVFVSVCRSLYPPVIY